MYGGKDSNRLIVLALIEVRNALLNQPMIVNGWFNLRLRRATCPDYWQNNRYCSNNMLYHKAKGFIGSN
jgi:hypothetical protein